MSRRLGHYVVKRSQGGSDWDLDALVALCRRCHAQTDAPFVTRLHVRGCTKSRRLPAGIDQRPAATAANGCIATATYAGDTNHNSSSDSKSITITQAGTSTTVVAGTTRVTYTATGSPVALPPRRYRNRTPPASMNRSSTPAGNGPPGVVRSVLDPLIMAPFPQPHDAIFP